MCASEQRAEQIEREQTLKDQQPTCLPGKNQRTLKPQREDNPEISQVAKIQEVLRSILLPVKRRPDQHPGSPTHLEPERQAHGGHCTRASRNPCGWTGLRRHSMTF